MSRSQIDRDLYLQSRVGFFSSFTVTPTYIKGKSRRPLISEFLHYTHRRTSRYVLKIKEGNV